jgi:hypothetical protein
MRKLLFTISLIVASLTFTSCIDLIEEVSINNNLSGTYEMRLETAGFGGMMSQMGGAPDLPQLREMDAKINQLSQQAGITNVKKNIKLKEMKFNISFDFENEDALNNAMYTLAELKPNVFVKKFLKVRKNKVVRPNLSPYLERLIKEQNLKEQIPSEDMLNYVNYKFIVNTPREIKRVLNDKAVISSDRKTVIATYSFKELLMDSESAYLKVKM